MDFLAHHAPVIGLLFFFVIFCVIAFIAYRPKNKKTIQSHAFIPLKED
jgi:cbb3-type cytochrome oxidase subunit 3